MKSGIWKVKVFDGWEVFLKRRGDCAWMLCVLLVFDARLHFMH
jgi:hypothetical protein